MDRSSEAPIAVDIASVGAARRNWTTGLPSRIPQSWVGMSGYLVAGVLLGLVLIVALGITRGDSTKAAAAGVVTDNVVHLRSTQLAAQCWRGVEDDGPARITVSLEVGLDGKVRNARAAGESPAMRACIESHVKAWEFLPQANPSQMVLPFEIDPR